jgi:hypothetical protein
MPWEQAHLTNDDWWHFEAKAREHNLWDLCAPNTGIIYGNIVAVDYEPYR